MVKLSHVYFIIFILLVYGFSYSDTHYVSLDGTNDSAGQYTDWAGAATQIQWAVTVAAAGETVWVSNGTYVLTNQIVIDHGITLKSLKGRTATSINGNYPNVVHRCLYVSSSAATIDGFTISNGYSTVAADAVGSGGGVRLQNGTVMNCLISRNNVERRGGGIYCDGDTQNTVSNCVIEYNTGPWAGGGIYYSGDSTSTRLYVLNCNVTSNTGNAAGGGILVYEIKANTNIIIRNCVISYNSGASSADYGCGAGVSLLGPGIVENCTIIGNKLTGNNAGGGGIGDRLAYGVGCEGHVNNCIIYSNTAAVGGANWNTNVAVSMIFSNTCTYPTNDMVGSGNITNNPSFVNYSAGNFRLNANSPCVNKGINQSWMTGAVDLDGRIRIRYRTVDMGAYERIYDGSIYSVH